ncbi:alpha/beta hydrolase [Orenia marismortui]|uniref:alpha/beta hydrolase n=1 Tax=Orenia marismortui TaxID=46469 RepID=UPI00035E41DB|nr:alpha/beta hydrolase-fold protein [Orenia marismortui]
MKRASSSLYLLIILILLLIGVLEVNAMSKKTYAKSTLKIKVANGKDFSVVGNVKIVDDFQMTPLDRKRRIWIYLPPDYNQSNKRYPVLYMHDGQKVFDMPVGHRVEWEVDESLERLFNENKTDGVIVVAVEHGGESGNYYRYREYAPWSIYNSQGEAPPVEADDYVEFIVSKLKPYIDNNYRTLKEREHTGIAGSSLGGLISLYAGLKYPNVFSKIGAFSPSLWVGYNESSKGNGMIFDWIQTREIQEEMKIYLYVGGQEVGGNLEQSKFFRNNVVSFYNLLQQIGFKKDDLKLVIDEEGNHYENYWAKYFPKAYLWLFE